MEHGFDGVMTSEHHGGFDGYLPNPLQAAGCCLEAMAGGWAAPCPLLLPLRPPALVARRSRGWRRASRVGSASAWRRARCPTTSRSWTHRWTTSRRGSPPGSKRWPGCSTGPPPRKLADDPAIAACREQPVPVLSAAMGFTAVRTRRAPRRGLLFDSLSTPERCRELTDAYRAAGGTGPCVMIRRAWVGEPPRQRLDDQLDVYRSYSSAAAQQHWGGDELVDAPTPARVIEGLVEALHRAGADAWQPARARSRGRPTAARGADRPAGRRGAARPPRHAGGARDVMSRRIYRFDDAEWHVPVAPGTDPEAAAEAGRAGAARRFLSQGDGGFYTQVVKLPPGLRRARAQPRPRRGVHGARGQLRVRRRADGALRPHGGGSRTSRTGSPRVPTGSRSSSCARARPVRDEGGWA